MQREQTRVPVSDPWANTDPEELSAVYVLTPPCAWPEAPPINIEANLQRFQRSLRWQSWVMRGAIVVAFVGGVVIAVWPWIGSMQ